MAAIGERIKRLWYAPSSEFIQTDLMQTLRWVRVPGDTVFPRGGCLSRVHSRSEIWLFVSEGRKSFITFDAKQKQPLLKETDGYYPCTTWRSD